MWIEGRGWLNCGRQRKLQHLLSKGQEAGEVFDDSYSMVGMQGQLQELGHLIDVGLGIPGLHRFKGSAGE